MIIEQKIFREHPLGKIAERTIGYEIQDKEGKFIRVGLEGAFGQYLKGEEGRRLKQKIAGGQWKPINDNNEKEPTEGFDIHTTINVNIQDITDLPKQMFEDKVTALAQKTQGTLIIKEYPTASAHSGHFKGLLNELALKKSFRPDIIFIDYLNICASSRYKAGSNVNSYSFIKAIAEELRGLAVEANLPIVSATQTTRSGFASSDVDLTDTSESFGLPATADLMFALISTEELEGMNQIMVKQLKNRYNDPTIFKRFIVGIDRAKMRLYDVEQNAQDDVVDNGHDKEDTPETKFKDKFGGFTF